MKREKGLTWLEGAIIVVVLVIVLALIAWAVIPPFMEENRVSKALDRLIEVEKPILPVLQEGTDDMSAYPSPEHPLYPKYLEERHTKHRYLLEYDSIKAN